MFDPAVKLGDWDNGKAELLSELCTAQGSKAGRPGPNGGQAAMSRTRIAKRAKVSLRFLEALCTQHLVTLKGFAPRRHESSKITQVLEVLGWPAEEFMTEYNTRQANRTGWLW